MGTGLLKFATGAAADCHPSTPEQLSGKRAGEEGEGNQSCHARFPRRCVFSTTCRLAKALPPFVPDRNISEMQDWTLICSVYQ